MKRHNISDGSDVSDSEFPRKPKKMGGVPGSLEIREQVYLDKKKEIDRQLDQLDAATLPEFEFVIKEIENDGLSSRYVTEKTVSVDIRAADLELQKEKAAALKEFEEGKAEAIRNMLADLEEQERLIHKEFEGLDIWNYDRKEQKPKSTRSLRRRATDPVPSDDKQKKQLANTTKCPVNEGEMEEDMLEIFSSCRSIPLGSFDRKGVLDLPLDIKLEEDKLIYGDKIFYRGQNLIIETGDKGSINVVIASIDTKDEIVNLRKLGGDSLNKIWPLSLLELHLGEYRIAKW